MENRDTFAATVAESARVDMERLGLQLTTFNIQDFTDRQHVIDNMGAEMAAEIQRNAKLASINAEQDVAVRQNQLDLKRAELQSIADKAQAEADAVKGITTAEQSKTLKVKEQEAEIAAAEKRATLEQRNADIEEQKLNAAVRKKADADRYAAEQKADADLYSTQKRAEAERYQREQEAQATQTTADADAHAVKVRGEAEGAAAQAKGVGEAEAIRAQGEAYNTMSNTYILAQQYIQVLPDMVRAAAEPLGRVDRITMYGVGNGAKLVGDTVDTVSQISEGLSQSLGIDLKALLNSAVAGHAAGEAAAKAAAPKSQTPAARTEEPKPDLPGLGDWMTPKAD